MTKTQSLSKLLRRVLLLSCIALAGMFVNDTPANAIPLIDAPGPDGIFGELAMNRNDDGSSNLLPLPFDVNFFGDVHSNFFINNNGNITFNNDDGTFTPDPFPVIGEPRIAPFWGDVDTRCATCGQVFVGSPNPDTVVVTWNDVGFFSSDDSRTNNFQAVIRNRSADFAPGDFDIEFRYDRLEWTTGDASGGSGGLGGIPAQAGFDAGDGVNFFTIPGSRTPAVLDLQNTSNVSPATPGLWSFAIRQGGVPGSTPDNPLLPIVNEEGFNFDFNIQLGQQIFIDPVIAVGYDYIVNSGPNIQSVLLPTIPGDDGTYSLFGFDGTEFTIFLANVLAGVEFDFGVGGVDRFRVLGIDQAALLDPTDPIAFVTGLTFVDSGQVNMNQNPVTFDTDPGTSVPEPSSALLLLAGLLSLLAIRNRRREGATFSF